MSRRNIYPVRYDELSNVADEISGNKLAAVGVLKPLTNDAYLTGFTNIKIIDKNILNTISLILAIKYYETAFCS